MEPKKENRNEEKNKEDKTQKPRKGLEQLEPREYMEFQLAYVISRLDPGNDGVELLSHHLANVRQGAWMGVGK